MRGGVGDVDLMAREALHVLAKEGVRTTLERLSDLPIVGDVRGAEFFYAVESVKDKRAEGSFTATWGFL
ncbi:hypothetical protein [Actinosynnema sp. NPDC023587]|uniref:hypothetical protein n=1 Tax=Actinosynnema sp. NPDC023587 TaxID=3154695 RepID=UPI0033E7B6D5